MSNPIYKNSYIVAFFSFVILFIIYYVFKIGANIEIVDGQVVKKVNWKVPLAISLIIWLIWYFVLYPPAKGVASHANAGTSNNVTYYRAETPTPAYAPPPYAYANTNANANAGTFTGGAGSAGANKLTAQRISNYYWK